MEELKERNVIDSTLALPRSTYIMRNFNLFFYNEHILLKPWSEIHSQQCFEDLLARTLRISITFIFELKIMKMNEKSQYWLTELINEPTRAAAKSQPI